MRYLCSILLALALAAGPLPVRAADRPQEDPPAATTEDSSRYRRAGLIIGGTLSMVTGMWISLYKRGKK